MRNSDPTGPDWCQGTELAARVAVIVAIVGAGLMLAEFVVDALAFVAALVVVLCNDGLPVTR